MCAPGAAGQPECPHPRPVPPETPGLQGAEPARPPGMWPFLSVPRPGSPWPRRGADLHTGRSPSCSRRCTPGTAPGPSPCSPHRWGHILDTGETVTAAARPREQPGETTARTGGADAGNQVSRTRRAGLTAPCTPRRSPGKAVPELRPSRGGSWGTCGGSFLHTTSSSGTLSTPCWSPARQPGRGARQTGRARAVRTATGSLPGIAAGP